MRNYLGKIKLNDSPNSVKRQFYLSHVRFVLEHFSPVWSPYLVTEIASLAMRRCSDVPPNLFLMISQIYSIEIDVHDHHTFLSIEKYMISVLYLFALVEMLIITFRILII